MEENAQSRFDERGCAMRLLKRLLGADSEARVQAELQRRKRKGEASYGARFENIRRLEAELHQNKAEYDHCRSPNQQVILESRINNLVRELEMQVALVAMTDRYMADIMTATHKSETVVAARQQNLGGAGVDWLAVELEEAIEQLRDTDAAMRQLRDQSYVFADRSALASPRVAASTQKIPEGQTRGSGLSTGTRERLKALGIDSDEDS